MYMSWQQPGTAWNCILVEYKSTQLVLSEEKEWQDVFVLSLRKAQN